MKTFLPNRASRLMALVILAPSLALGGCSLSQSELETEDELPGNSLYILTAAQIRRMYPSATSIEQLLEQSFSTVQFRGVDERPGASGTVYMLGAAAPLFVIDGVPIEYRGSLGLNPQDVERIELVKHGESAFYGFRGSSGAILITTKKSGDSESETKTSSLRRAR